MAQKSCFASDDDEDDYGYNINGRIIWSVNETFAYTYRFCCWTGNDINRDAQ
jgi:hypothetical protein